MRLPCFAHNDTLAFNIIAKLQKSCLISEHTQKYLFSQSVQNIMRREKEPAPFLPVKTA